MIFQAGNVHESASFLNLKERIFFSKDSRIRTHDLDDEDLLDGMEII